MTRPTNPLEALPADPPFGSDLTFTTRRRQTAGGTWVIGLVAGHRFEALVFSDHAENADYELGTSKISKLWVQRRADSRVVFHWDRGLDVPAGDATTQRVVALLAAELAQRVFGG